MSPWPVCAGCGLSSRAGKRCSATLFTFVGWWMSAAAAALRVGLCTPGLVVAPDSVGPARPLWHASAPGLTLPAQHAAWFKRRLTCPDGGCWTRGVLQQRCGCLKHAHAALPPKTTLAPTTEGSSEAGKSCFRRRSLLWIVLALSRHMCARGILRNTAQDRAARGRNTKLDRRQSYRAKRETESSMELGEPREHASAGARAQVSDASAHLSACTRGPPKRMAERSASCSLIAQALASGGLRLYVRPCHVSRSLSCACLSEVGGVCSRVERLRADGSRQKPRLGHRPRGTWSAGSAFDMLLVVIIGRQVAS